MGESEGRWPLQKRASSASEPTRTERGSPDPQRGTRQRAIVECDVAQALTQADPTVAFTIGTFDQLVEATATQERLIAMLSTFFGGLALLLAVVGLYGVVAHGVRVRQTEIGVRIAGGGPADHRTARLPADRRGDRSRSRIGTGWQLLGRSFRGDAAVPRRSARSDEFGGAAALLVAVGTLAAWMPARRAARLDPMIVLREG